MKFIFGIHNHQPVGNFDNVFEEAYQLSYLPFFDVLDRYPNITFSIHVSGPLLEWLQNNHPDYLDRIAGFVENDRCEVISSGFYEPILISISDSDKIGQIQMMNEFIEKRFGRPPEGLWLTERIWEPGLVRPLVESGIKYIAVDDQHFSAVGKPLDELTGYYLTEDQGYVLGVFPISQRLRYSMPFEDPKSTIDLLRSNDKDHNSVMVMADDGEKFGVWPNTNTLCYGEGWMNRMLSALSENSDWLETMTFRDYYHNHKPSGRVYLPTSSYFEMSEWTLPTQLGKKYGQYIERLKEGNQFQELRPFLKGGTWRDFLVKYDESNWMLKRANHVSSQVAERNGEIRKSAWRSQCNCGYWHGVFGGLYLPHLRHALYSNLLKAEQELNYPPYFQQDIDHDGIREKFMNNENLQVILTPKGGAVRELDVKGKCFNLVNTLARYEEHYHHKLQEAENNGSEKTASIHDIVNVKEQGLEKLLFVDDHPRWMFQDHFFPVDTQPKQFYKNSYTELGRFINQSFQSRYSDGTLSFIRVENIIDTSVKLEKTVRLDGSSILFGISLKNQNDIPLKCLYGSEFNFSLLGGHAPDRYYELDGIRPDHSCLDRKSIENASKIALVTEWEQIRTEMDFGESTEIWLSPVETVSMSEAGFERIYQSSVLLPVWKLDLQPKSEFKLEFKLTIETELN